MVVHVCNSSYSRDKRQKDHKFKTSPSIVSGSPYFKNKKTSGMALVVKCLPVMCQTLGLIPSTETKQKNRTKERWVLSGGWHQWEGEGIRKGWRQVNMVKVLCIHVWEWNNETYWNSSKKWGLRGRGIKEKVGGGDSKIYCKHFCKCYSVSLVQL
jgi:hypothetical protein